MLADRHNLPLTTASVVARDAYVQGCEAQLAMHPGGIEAFDRAIAADPGFALAHAAKAHALLDRGNAAAARESIATARSLTGGLTEREVGHIAFFGLLVAGDPWGALAALPTHLDAWPTDVLVLSTTASTNGLIGSSGGVTPKRTLLALLDKLAPHYGDDWWFTAHHGMALSENGQHAAAREKIDQALAQNPRNPWAAHASAHLSYELGDPTAARHFLRSWLATAPRTGALYSHLSWHLALTELEAGEPASACQLFRDAVAPDTHSGAPRQKLNDAVSFLWRSELAGHPRDPEAWRVMRDYADNAFPQAGAAFSDVHIALVHVATGNASVLETRAQQIEALARNGRYPAGPHVASVSVGFAAFERGDFQTAIDALEPVADALERIGGSHAQLDLVRFTLLKAYLGADRPEDAYQAHRTRRPRGRVSPVTGMPSGA